MIFGSLRTNRTLLGKALSSRAQNETFRFWEESSRFSDNPYPLFRVYSETLPGSEATKVLARSSTYREISRNVFETEVGLPTARRIWANVGKKGNLSRPTLLLMAGVPLSGKTTLAKEIVKRASDEVVLIENDEVRKIVAAEMGNEWPKYTMSEHRKTFNVSWELIRFGLSSRCHVIFDATNLTEKGREGAYEAGDENGAAIQVLLVSAKPEDIAERYRLANSDKRKAYDKLGSQELGKFYRSVSHITVESDVEPAALIERISSTLIVDVRTNTDC